MSVIVERCLTGRLAAAYPVSRHDVELRVTDVPVDRLAGVLAEETSRALDADQTLRKVIFAAPLGDLAAVAAAEEAGFRFVVDVDLPDEELSLMVHEPAWVTAVDMDLGRVPQT